MTTPATTPHEKQGEGLLANVSAVLIAQSDEGATRELADALEDMFEDVVVIDAAPHDIASGETALRELVAALAAAREDRVLVVRSGARKATPHVWLGLTAYPEHDVVTEHDALTPAASPITSTSAIASPGSALYRRAVVLAEATARLRAIEATSNEPNGGAAETPEQALRSLNTALDTKVIEGADIAPLCEADT